MSDLRPAMTPVASKPYRCGECARTISVGERYDLALGKRDGVFRAFRACRQCAAAREVVARRFDLDYCEEYYGGLGEWLEDNSREYPGAFRLFACFRAKWRYQSGALMPIPGETAA